MEHGDSQSVMEQSQMKMMLVKTEVEAAAPALFEIEIDLNHLTQEPGLVQSIKSQPLLMKEEVLEGSGQEGNEQQSVQGASTSAGTGSVNEGCSTSLGDLSNVKQELGDIDIGPTVFQHMDIHYAINKNPSSAEISTIPDDCNEATPGSGVRKESFEDKLIGNRTIPCKYCCQTTAKVDYDMKSCLGQQKDLQKHLLYQHQVLSSDGYKCDACGTTLHKPQLLSHTYKELHERNSNMKPYQCDMCHASFKQKTGLNNHQMRTHTVKKPYQCNICKLRFVQRSDLTTHVRVHTGEKPYSCDTCGKKFARSSTLIKHMRIHTGEKPYQCDTCGAKFAQRSVLTMHVTIHTDEKPYQCVMCHERFKHKIALNNHHIRTHTVNKPHSCNICKVRFLRRSDLTMHMRVHSGVKPYQCDTCDARFARNDTLTNHKRIHTGEKPYRCDTCGKKFARRSRLTKHITNVHADEKPYQCDMCHARFKQKAGLINHHNRTHTVKKTIVTFVK